ncbi:MAG TPA: hypothetical protein VK477_01305, partial [Acidobacteriota bacterium]|nr:hypothetical protein [Acidobacteriota bacterium]
LGAGLFPATSLAQPSVSNLYDALARSDTRYTGFTYDPADAVIQDTDTEHHIQGIAYANGYYYVAQSRPTTANTEKLLVVSEDTQTVVNKLDLDPGSIHPGGLQAHNGYMVIPFEVSGGNAKLNFYSLSTPTNPVLVASYQTALGNGYCAGMTDYGDKFLVAQYYSRTGSIRFYHFDSAFNKVAEKTWRASAQTDKSGWYPYTDWRAGDYNYEAMNLIKVLPPGSSTPSYFMIMYHNTNSADVFALSDPNLSDALQVTMVYSLQFTPYGPSFRYGAGVSITDPDNLLFFSSLKHVHASKSANVISDFESRPAWPWKLPYNYATGGDADVALNDSGVCVELRRGAPGTADESKIFSQVGVTMPATRTVAWGSSVDTGQTGETVSVAMNSSGYCVALSRGTGSNSNQHTYRVGEVDVATKTITWGAAINYQTGGNLAVALDDSNHVVEVHRGTIGGANENKHYYRVGTLDPSTKTITWLTGGTNYGTGGDLSLAIDDSGHAIEIHRGTPGTSSASSHYYRTASINTSTGVITWGAAVSYDTGGDVDI